MNTTFTDSLNLFDLFVAVVLIFLFWDYLKRLVLRNELKDLRKEFDWLEADVEQNKKLIDTLLAYLNLYATRRRKEERFEIHKKEGIEK